MRWLKTYGLYLGLALAVFLPLLGSGYVLTLDMVFTPQLRLPDGITNDYPFYLVLYLLDLVLPSELIQKMLLLAILPIAGIGAHRLLAFIGADKNRTSDFGLYIAGTLYAINPYTYSRFMAGQYLVLIGYALLPWFLGLLLQCIRRPHTRAALRLAGLTLVIGATSVHTLGLLAVITTTVLVVSLWPRRKLPTAQQQDLTVSPDHSALLRYGVLAATVFVVGSSYWIIPTVMGESSTVRTMQQFDTSHAQAFATGGETLLAKIGNVLQLQGFWAERHGLYLLPQDQLPGWGTVRLLVWTLTIFGAVALWRRARRMAIILFVVAGTGLLLSIGVGQSLLTALGYREPHKFVGLMALVFALFAGLGTNWLLATTRQKGDQWHTVASCVVVTIILLFTPTMYWGFAGQLSPRNYPNDWFALNERLNQDTGTTTTIFLPWHQYMSFPFSGRIIANPAPHFFDKPVIASNDPELGGIRQPGHDPVVADVAAVLSRAAERSGLGQRLAQYNVKYIIITQGYDHQKYSYLDQQKDLQIVWQTPTTKLYQNLALQQDTPTERDR